MQKISHAFFHRIYVRLGLVAALVGGVPLASHAAYATLTPPPGWVAGGGAAVAGPGGTYAAQTTANQWISNASRSSAMLNVGGKQQAINVSMKLAPNAGRVAAAALFLSPQLRAAVGIAAWLGVSGVIWDAVNNRWVNAGSSPEPSTGLEWRSSELEPAKFFPTEQGACNSAIPALTALYGGDAVSSTGHAQGTCTYTRTYSDGSTESVTRGSLFSRPASCPAGWYVTPAGCVQNKPATVLTQKEMVDLLNPDNTPGWPSPSVPGEFPIGTPFPIQLPVVNPDTGVNPFPKPMFYPTGDPVRNPKYNPNAAPSPTNQPWKQPGTTVTPRPTVDNPWRVDIQPTDRPQAGPEPEPEPPPNTEPDTNTKPGDEPKPEEQQSLCEKHPEILACAKPDLDTPDGDIPKSSADVSLVEENLFGAGSCPADLYFSPSGLQQFKVWDWNQSCGYISTYVKPILILCCTFSAFMILIPGRTE